MKSIFACLLLAAALPAVEPIGTIDIPLTFNDVQVHEWTDNVSGKRFLVFKTVESFQVMEANPKPIPPKPPVKVEDLPPVEATGPVPEISRTYGAIPPGWVLLKMEGQVKVIRKVTP